MPIASVLEMLDNVSLLVPQTMVSCLLHIKLIYVEKEIVEKIWKDVSYTTKGKEAMDLRGSNREV